jgi:hypothetical protein
MSGQRPPPTDGCFPGAYVLCALSWAHVRVWGAAGRGCDTPAWSGSAHFVCFPYVNRALFGISTSADRWPPCWRCMPCTSYAGPLGASLGPPIAAVTRPDDGGVRVWHVQNAESRFMLPLHSMGAHGATARGFRMERSAHAEFGESTCTGWVLSKLMLPRSGCAHASHAPRVRKIGRANAHAYIAHD